MRTALTMLGIIIGVGAVICVVAIGEGASASVARAITNIGANMIWVEAGSINRSGVRTGTLGTPRLTLGDFEAIKEHIPLVTNVTPQADTRVQVVYGNHAVTRDERCANQSKQAGVFLIMVRKRLLQPKVVAADRDPEDAAHHLDAVLISMGLNEGVGRSDSSRDLVRGLRHGASAKSRMLASVH
jgi:ABC-type lipoprotein release transport system permease subunit